MAGRKPCQLDYCKADVFSAGLVILEAANLRRMRRVYGGPESKIFYPELLQQELDILKNRYPENNLLFSTVKKMLEQDPERRPTFIEILEKLPDYKLIKAHFLMNGDSLPVEVLRQQASISPQPEDTKSNRHSHNIPLLPLETVSNQILGGKVHPNHETKLSSNNKFDPRASEVVVPSKGLSLTSASKIEPESRRQTAYRSCSAPFKESTGANTLTQPSPPQTSERLRKKPNPEAPQTQVSNPLKRRNSFSLNRKSLQQSQRQSRNTDIQHRQSSLSNQGRSVGPFTKIGSTIPSKRRDSRDSVENPSEDEKNANQSMFGQHKYQMDTMRMGHQTGQT